MAVVLVWTVLAGIGYYVVSLFSRGNPAPPNPAGGRGPAAAGSVDPASVPAAAATASAAAAAVPVELGVAYGTEKRRWLEGAVDKFAATPEGRHIKIRLLPMGSLEAAHAILDGNQKIHVWSPASSLYTGVFRNEWQLKHSNNPIAREEMLALSPMVFVMWRDRYEAFAGKYKEISFAAVAQALDVAGGWGAIAQHPDWGVFKFGHTHPNESNSGLASLILMAYDFHNKNRDLTVADVVQPDFQTWLGKLERGVSGLSNSTANLMRDMVLKGPSTFDGVLVYESVAIDFLPNAEGRWGELHVVYPKYNLWNDNPYYILDTEWSTPAHREAAEAFLQFLMSESVQKEALTHGFRPGNAAVPVKFPESPFSKYEKFGLRIDVSTICDPPPPEVINNLQQIWQRAAGSR